jgi:hypothetical protein
MISSETKSIETDEPIDLIPTVCINKMMKNRKYITVRTVTKSS